MGGNVQPMPLPTPVPEPPACIGGTIYTIRPGDTMFRIANRYGVNLIDLINANPQIPNPNVIYVGQRICIPEIITPTPPPDEFCLDGTIYIVQRGDTMFNISRRFGVTLQRLIQANPQIPDPNVLNIGDRICVPVPDLPLPEGICRVELRPEATGVLGGTAFIDFTDPTVWITTVGLPRKGEIGHDAACYYAWLVDTNKSKFFRIELKHCGVNDILAGYEKVEGCLADYDEIIVTAEVTTCVKKPTGPVLLSGDLTACR